MSDHGFAGDGRRVVDCLLEQAVAMLMRDELEANRLEVTIAPCWGNYGDDGRWNRIVEWRNPAWYSELCEMYTSNRRRPRRRRKHDTLIKRQLILRALSEIGSGNCQTINARRVYPFVRERAQAMLAEKQQEETAVEVSFA